MNALDELRQCTDVATLKPALPRICERFGRIARLDILTAIHESTKQAICFLRMDTSDKEMALMKSMGVGRFGGEVVFVVDLNAPVLSEDAGPPSQRAEFEDRS
jgi:hypothetical protein